MGIGYGHLPWDATRAVELAFQQRIHMTFGTCRGRAETDRETGMEAGLFRCEPSLSLARRAVGRVLLAWV